ncbi:MAG: YadA-like family protein [Cyanobacteria bacterium J06554_6]
MKRTQGLASVALAATVVLASPLGVWAQQLPDYDYIGIGGGDDGLVVNGKYTLGDNLSIRPAVATDFDGDDGSDVTYLLPVTYDFNALDDGGRLYPFVGTGIGGDIGDDSTIDFALTGGLDYRISDRWVANGSVSYLPFADGDDVDFAVGVGYTF